MRDTFGCESRAHTKALGFNKTKSQWEEDKTQNWYKPAAKPARVMRLAEGQLISQGCALPTKKVLISGAAGAMVVSSQAQTEQMIK
eukprot:5584913-Amphidinium_carterae.1